MSTHGPHSCHKTNAEAEARESGDVLGVQTTANCTVGLPSPEDDDVYGLTKFPANRPRLEPEGLRCHLANTNEFDYSEQLDNGASWAALRAVFSPNFAVAPDGTMTAEKLVEDSTLASTHYGNRRSAANPIADATRYVFSCILKADGRDVVQWKITLPASGSFAANFDLSAGTATPVLGAPDLSIVSYGGGWYRCSFSFMTAPVGDAGNAALFFYLLSGGSISYDGDGVSGVLFWGAQRETGKSLPGVYVPTGAATASSIAPVNDFNDDWHLYNVSRDAVRVDVRLRYPAVPADGADYPVFCIYEDATHYCALYWCPAGGGDTWKVNQNQGGGLETDSPASAWVPAVDTWYELRFRAHPVRAQMTLDVVNLDTDAVVESVAFDLTYHQLDAAHLYTNYHPATGGQHDCWIGEVQT